jgi:hypothetical protein
MPVRAFRDSAGQMPNLSPGAAVVRAGLIAQSTWGLAGTVRIRLDNLRVRRLPAVVPVALVLDDLGQAWGDQPPETIEYEITVTNGGTPRTGLVVEVRVPLFSCFSANESTTGWECAGGGCAIGAEVFCRHDVEALAPGQRAELDFAVAVVSGIPPEWEFLAESRLLSPDGEEVATEDEVTPPVALAGGPGCLCLFAPDLCGGG